MCWTGPDPELLVELVWPDLPAWDGLSYAVLYRFSDEDRPTVGVWPALRRTEEDGTPLATHPFLLCWAILYAFSNFVRYEARAGVSGRRGRQ